MLAKPYHDGAEIDRARLRARSIGPIKVVGVRPLSAAAPDNRIERLQLFRRGSKGDRRSMYGQIRSIETTKLFRPRVHMDKLGLRSRNLDEFVALRSDFPHPAADEENEVGLIAESDQSRIGTDPEIADI